MVSGAFRGFAIDLSVESAQLARNELRSTVLERAARYWLRTLGSRVASGPPQITKDRIGPIAAPDTLPVAEVARNVILPIHEALSQNIERYGRELDLPSIRASAAAGVAVLDMTQAMRRAVYA